MELSTIPSLFKSTSLSNDIKKVSEPSPPVRKSSPELNTSSPRPPLTYFDPFSRSCFVKTSASSVPKIFLFELSSVNDVACSSIWRISALSGAAMGALSSSPA